MGAAQLLAIVEVPHDKRVRCQAPECNHPVFRRIHVVSESSGIHVLGSECFKKLFLGLPIASATPKYTATECRMLTDEECRLLVENTERLIQQFEIEHYAEVARRASLAKSRSSNSKAPPPHPIVEPTAVLSETARHNAEDQAKQIVRAKYGVNPDLPGWRGLVASEIERILKGNAR